jgi:ABC-type sugar transport system ATPase subunit
VTNVPGVTALDNVSMKPARFTASGENGAGKSTLMKILSGTRKEPTKAHSLRRPELERPIRRARRDSIVYQELTLVPQRRWAKTSFGRERSPGSIDWSLYETRTS